MFHRYAVAIGAGSAAALLFAVSSGTSPLAMALAYLAPLPIMIATLGWGLLPGAVAAAVSTVALGALAEPASGLLFSASIAAPAWLLAAFSVTPIQRYWPRRAPGEPAYASVGAIVLMAACVGMAGAVAMLTGFIAAYHGYAEAAKAATEFLAPLLGDAFEDPAAARQFAEVMVRIGPAAIAGSTLTMLSVNLYAAARSTQLSRSLTRPWPDLPTSLGLPWPLGIAAIACAAGAYALPAPASQYFSIGLGGLGAAFCLQGLAVAHALSRGLALRPVMLVALYACCVLRANYILPVVAALGLLDAVVKLRSRPAFLPTPNPTARK
jgi:Predicted membrane protein (DUF2232)